jgi:hypothetical protein
MPKVKSCTTGILSGGQSNQHHFGRKEWPSPDIKPASALILDVPVSRSIRNKFLVYKLSSLGYFVIALRTD